jgi:hypothetical protein
MTTALDAAINERDKQRFNKVNEGRFAFGMAAIP